MEILICMGANVTIDDINISLNQAVEANVMTREAADECAIRLVDNLVTVRKNSS